MAETSDVSTSLACELDDLWDGEQEVWKLVFEAPSYGSDPTWHIDLEWTPEYGPTPHQADWVTYTWQFYGDTAEEALAGAIEWCKALLPFERCGACDGDGAYNVEKGVRRMCEECSGTGLANVVAVRRQGGGLMVNTPTDERDAYREALEHVVAAADDPEQPGETQRLADVTQIATEALAFREEPRGDPCAHCDDTGWVEDKNWQPEFHGQERVEHNGLIPCGLCT